MLIFLHLFHLAGVGAGKEPQCPVEWSVLNRHRTGTHGSVRCYTGHHRDAYVFDQLGDFFLARVSTQRLVMSIVVLLLAHLCPPPSRMQTMRGWARRSKPCRRSTSMRT